MRLFFQILQTHGDFHALLSQQIGIQHYAVALHAQQDRDQRLLDIGVQGAEFWHGFQSAPQFVVQAQCNVRILCRVRTGLFQRDLVEGQLLCAFTGDILERNSLDTEVSPGNRIHVVAGHRAVQHIGFEHRVILHATHAYAVIGQYVRVVFQMMTHFLNLRVLEQRLQGREHFVA